MGIYMGGLILGAILQYMVSASLTLLLPWAHICAFGQIQVLAKFETSVFDEVYVKFSRIYTIGKQFFMILQST